MIGRVLAWSLISGLLVTGAWLGFVSAIDRQATHQEQEP